MMSEEIYCVVINAEEQYSIWLENKPLPEGWKNVGFSGFETECLDYINTHWTDMRPLSLRKEMAAVSVEPHNLDLPPPSSSLVDRLSEGVHPVSMFPLIQTRAQLEDALKHGCCPLMFTATKGGTTLQITIDIPSDRISELSENGSLRIEGSLVLDFQPVRCVAEIDVNSLEGTGTLIKENKI